MSFKIVVMSCDKNQDLWKPFYLCMEKYWKNHPEIIYSTESIENPYYKTICKNIPVEKWTKRVYETIKDLSCKHILLMVDDLFIRDYVNNDLITLLSYFVNGDFASLNMEKTFDNLDTQINELMLVRNPKGKFRLSCMCQLWRKSAMLDLFNCELNPWEMEKKGDPKQYKYLISKNGDFIKFGRKEGTWVFGVVKGKWSQENKEFFDKEGIEIDYSIRGFYD